MENFEEKYNQALERARHALKTDLHESGHWAITYIFPELKHPTDNEIREALISVLESDFEPESTINDITVNNIVDWLKSQDAKTKHSHQEVECAEIHICDSGFKDISDRNHVMPMKFKVGDWIVFDNNLNGNSIYQYHIEKIENYHYTLRHILGGSLLLPFGNESHIRPLTLDDSKDGDVLDANGAPFIYKKHNKDYVYFYCGVNLADAFIEATENDIWNSNTKVYPATKEQRDLLFQKMKEAGYRWDAENKELKKIESTIEEVNDEDYGIDGLYHAQRILEKTLGTVDGYETDDGILEHKCAIAAVNKIYKHNPTWNEEDNENVKDILYVFKQLKDTSFYKEDDKAENIINWIKSLKYRFI